MQLGDGNELDQKAFAKMIKEFKSQWQGQPVTKKISESTRFELGRKARDAMVGLKKTRRTQRQKIFSNILRQSPNFF